MRYTLILLLFSFQIQAQEYSVIRGVVSTEQGETLPYANVFINNTSIGTTTNVDGEYELIVNLPGTVDLVCSYSGFKTKVNQLVITPGSKSSLDFKLEENIIALETVAIEVEKDKQWEKDLKKFKKYFLGSSMAAKETEIVNPEIIDFSREKNSILKAFANEAIVIRNNYLGYQIRYNLESFWLDQKSGRYEYLGFVFFEYIDTDSREKLSNWKRNREITYSGSYQHFLKSVLTDNLTEEGFRVYRDDKGQSKPLYYEDIKTLSREDLLDEIGSRTLFKDFDLLRVEYIYRKNYKLVGGRSEPLNETSWLELKNNDIEINRAGRLLNPLDIVVYGAFEKKRVADLLPLDFSYSQEKKTQNN